MTTETKPFGIGSKVYSYDRWSRDKLIVELTVVAETSKSWLISRWHLPESFIEQNDRECYKLPKKGEGETRAIKVSNHGTTHQTFYLSRQRLDDQLWMNKNQYAIGEAVGRIDDISKLRAVAELIGYVEKS